jgi:hypothetical protein
MIAQLSIIDTTARQYVFTVTENGLLIKTLDRTEKIMIDNNQEEFFNIIFLHKVPFTIIDINGTFTFNPTNLVGVKFWIE